MMRAATDPANNVRTLVTKNAMYATHQGGKALKYHSLHFLLDFLSRISDEWNVCGGCVDGTQWDAIRARR